MSKACEKAFDPTDLDALSAKFESFDLKDATKIRELINLQQTMGDELIARFARNIAAFEKYMPDVAETFRKYRPEETIEFFCAPNGIPNLIFPKTNEIFYKCINPLTICETQVDMLLERQMFSQVRYNYENDWCGQIHHRYMNDAVRIIKSYQDNEQCPKLSGAVPCCIMLGAGLGYPIAMLYERIEIANMIIIEPNLDLFFASLHTFDWAPLLDFLNENNYGLYLVLGQTEEMLYDELNKFYTKHGKFLSGFYFVYVHYRSAEINKCADVIAKEYGRIYSSMGFYDDHIFALSHGCDNIINKKGLANKKSIPEEYKKLPVFIIGNGPSLDQDIDFIRKNQDKALIIACGTALESLYRAGVQADFYAATERTPQICETLQILPDKSYLDRVILLTAEVIHPYTTEMFKRTCIFAKTDEPFYWMLMSSDPQTALQWQSVLLMNPLVGNCGLAVALCLNFKDLYFFGIDNGTKIEETMNEHSEFSSVYVNKKTIRGEDIRGKVNKKYITKGNFGGEVYSPNFYRLSLRHLELLIERSKHLDEDFSCTNCSDGAFIEGAAPLRSEDLIPVFESKQPLDKKTILDTIYDIKTFTIDKTREDVLDMLAIKEFFATIGLILKITAKRPDDRMGYIQMLEQISEIIYKLRATKQRYVATILEGSTQTLFILASYCLFKRNDPEQGLKLANEIIDNYERMLNDAKKLYEMMPNFILGPHQKQCHYKVGFDHGDFKAPDMPQIPHVFSTDVLDKVVYEPFKKNYGSNA